MSPTRRSPVELRVLLLKAAEQVFAEKGYAATTTKDLAREAGVAESVLFRHFPTKAALFRESVLDPLTQVLKSFSDASARWFEQPLDDAAIMRVLMSELLDQLTAHREALRSFTAAEDDLDPAARADFHRSMNEVLDRLGAIAHREGMRRNRGQIGLGPDMIIRVAVGMVISVVVHDTWLLPSGPNRPTRQEVSDHLTAFMLQGIGPGAVSGT